MKAKYFSSLLVLFLMIIFSCKKELEPQESSVGINPVANSGTPSSQVMPPEANLNPNQNQSLIQQSLNKNTSGNNPPHGQVGHRCDIADGAPLNSKPNKSISNPPQTNTVSNSSVQMVSKSISNSIITKPGMNPAHGQKGHRCDVAVGAPLNSAPTKVTPVASATNPEVPEVLKLDTTAILSK